MTSKQKKIRDIERLLRRIDAKSTPSANAIVETIVSDGSAADSTAPFKVGREEFRKNTKLKQKMDELENLRRLREESLKKVRERKNSVKYHLVRFLERKRVTRMICSIDSKITMLETTSSEESSAKERKKTLKLLQSQRSSLEKDLIYIMYYPMEYKYISLFAKSEEEKKSKGSDLESKEGSDEKICSSQRHSALSQKVRHLAEATYQADIDGDGGDDGDDSGVSGNRPNKVQHALDVAKKKRQQRQRQRLSSDGADADEAPQATGEKKQKRKASPPEESPHTLDRDDHDREKSKLLSLFERQSPAPSSQRKKSKSEPETTAPQKKEKVAAPRKPSDPSQRASVPSDPSPLSEPSGDAFFMEEASEQERAAADEELQRRRQEHDRLRIGDLKVIRKKKYKHRSLFKKR